MKPNRFCRDLLIISIGALIMAIGINMFVANHHLAIGGVTGICVILEQAIKIPISMSNMIISIPLLLIGTWAQRDLLYFVKSIIASFEVSIFLSLTISLQSINSSYLIASILGGLILGTGISIVLFGGATTGGTDTIALILEQKFKLPKHITMRIFDGAVILSGAMIFGIQNLLYSIILLILLTQTVKILTLRKVKITTGYNAADDKHMWIIWIRYTRES